ncbi:type 1 glutamine amidotransferase [Agarilytica rhodophyticola]|uniref:type 1 glutamine amidotransferase n=1 Tax=Agarilytica rhodophyticola TaxID=1737490 RepID=UPI000B342969|nr:type 1 glutamine amidotransferase [Agarilytica rhodophyticola]
MRVHYFQHVPFEDLSLIENWVSERKFSLSVTSFFKDNYQIPRTEDFDLLIVLGGPMSVHDQDIYPWLVKEKECIKKSIDEGKQVLGICLGAQLIAQVLDAKVKTNKNKEIGWYPIAFTDQIVGHPLLSGLNYAITVLHWHEETFGIPSGATHIASSAACKHQGFLYQDNVLALQFHMEMDYIAVDKIITACKKELVDGPYIQDQSSIQKNAENYDLKHTLFQLLDNWILMNPR